jgi:hypothetical protein
MKKIDMDEYKNFEEQFLTTQKVFYAKVAEAKEKLIAIHLQISEVFDSLQEPHGDMMTAKDELDGFLSTQIGDIENHMDLKSEKWQEGVTGEAYNSWKEHLQEIVYQLNDGMSDTLPDAPEVANILDDIDTEYEFEGLGEDFSDINSVLATV